jgi:hypothetical protein
MIMKLNTIALAAAFALTSSFALAQAGGADSGAQVPEKGAGTMGTTNNGAHKNGTMTKGTTGMSRSGTGTAPEGMTPGSTDESKPGGRSTARTPSGN